MKTLDIICLEWFDKVNGNSYFAATITIDFCTETEKTLHLPFQYGYGDHYKDMAMRKLMQEGYIVSDDRTALWRYCRENNIILRTTKHENCLKRELREIDHIIDQQNKANKTSK